MRIFFILILSILFGTSSTLWSQEVILEVIYEPDTIKNKQVFKFSSFKEAESVLNFKTDSLRKAGFPFLSQNKNISGKKIFTKLNLNQRVDSLRINVKESDLVFLPDHIKGIQNQIRIPYTELNLLLSQITYRLKLEGLPFAQSSLKNIKIHDHNSIEADLFIKSGDKRTIDKINIKGYSSLSEAYLNRFSNLKVGKVFIESEIQEKTDKLNNIAFINVKKPTEVLFKKDSTELFVYLEKISSNSFDGFLGFGNNENDDFQLNGYLNMVLLNNLNFGERLGIVYKNDGIGQQTFEGNLNLPFLFKSPVSLDAGLRIFRRDSSFSNTSQTLNLSYQLNEKFSLKTGLEFTSSTNIESDEVINSEIIDFNTSFYGVGFDFINVNSREGFNENTFLRAMVSVGTRKAETSSDQYKLTLEGQHQISLNYRNKIYLNFNGQFLKSENYFNNELFRFGGVNSIRGFAENSLIGNRFAVLQTEYRYLLDSNLFANTVLDLGNYTNKSENFSENILGYGIGLGLKSKAGIFRLVLANALSNSQEASFSNSKIHISFTSFF